MNHKPDRDPFDPINIAADYILGAVTDVDDRMLLLWTLRGGSITAPEAKRLEPLAGAIAYYVGRELPSPRTTRPMTIVVDTESDDPMPLGTYVATPGDAVSYRGPDGHIKFAPADSVAVITVNIKEG